MGRCLRLALSTHLEGDDLMQAPMPGTTLWPETKHNDLSSQLQANEYQNAYDNHKVAFQKPLF